MGFQICQVFWDTLYRGTFYEQSFQLVKIVGTASMLYNKLLLLEKPQLISFTKSMYVLYQGHFCSKFRIISCDMSITNTVAHINVLEKIIIHIT